MPLVAMIVTGTGRVEEDASETGMSKMCLHRSIKLGLPVVRDCVHNKDTFQSRNLAGLTTGILRNQDIKKAAPPKGAPPRKSVWLSY